MRAALLLAAALLCGAVLPRTAAAQSADPAAAVRAHYAAWNRVDHAAVAASFADDATIDDGGTIYAGREQFTPWVARFLTADQNITLSNVRVDGGRVTWEWTRLGDAARQQLSVPFTRGEAEAVVAENGLITDFAIRIDRAATPQFEAAYRAVIAQAAAAQATRVAQAALAGQAGGAPTDATGPPNRPSPTAGQLVVGAGVAIACIGAYAALKRPIRAV